MTQRQLQARIAAMCRLWKGAVLLFACFFASVAGAQVSGTHQLSSTTQSLLLSDRALFLVDPSAALTVTQVAALSESGAMKRVANPRIPMVRIDRGEVFWLRVEAEAASDVPTNWMLEVEKAVLSRVQLFVQSESGWNSFPVVGAKEPFSARLVDHRNYVFPVSVTPGARASFLVRVEATGPATPKVTLWKPEALQASSLAVSLFLCLYFGLAIGMVLYNLLLYVVVKERGYLLYVGCVTCTSVAFAAQSGIASQYAWGEAPWWNSHAMYFGFSGASLFSALLTRSFLRTWERLPLANAVLLGIAWCSAAMLVAVAFLPGNISTLIQVPVAIVSAIVVTGAAVVGARRRWPGAKYFLAAWATLYVGVVVMLARIFHVIPDSVISINALAISSAFEMVLLSLALADGINDEKRQKEEAQSFTVGILEASQALGTETRLEGLHARVCDVMAKLTGASDVLLVARDPDVARWFLIVPGAPDNRLSIEEAGERGLIDLQELKSIQANPEPVTYADGRAVLPILHHGVLSAVLILVHRDATTDFSPTVQTAIQGIAGPLAVSLENVLLYERLEQHVTERTRELREAQQKLISTARRVGRAEIANNVLHNVGNTLNSVNVSAELIRSRIDAGRANSLERAADLLDSQADSLGTFFTSDQRGLMFPRYLRELADTFKRERGELKEHLHNLVSSIDHIKSVVRIQQTHAGHSLVVEEVVPDALVDEALRITVGSHAGLRIDIVKELETIGPVLADKTRTLEVLINLMHNAIQAMAGEQEAAPVLILRTQSRGDVLRIDVQDSGCGIAPENLTKIFSHGFTMRPGGHGFGLHGCALAASEMGGSLVAHSAGLGKGATFTLELPVLSV